MYARARARVRGCAGILYRFVIPDRYHHRYHHVPHSQMYRAVGSQRKAKNLGRGPRNPKTEVQIETVSPKGGVFVICLYNPKAGDISR